MKYNVEKIKEMTAAINKARQSLPELFTRAEFVRAMAGVRREEIRRSWICLAYAEALSKERHNLDSQGVFRNGLRMYRFTSQSPIFYRDIQRGYNLFKRDNRLYENKRRERLKQEQQQLL